MTVPANAKSTPATQRPSAKSRIRSIHSDKQSEPVLRTKQISSTRSNEATRVSKSSTNNSNKIQREDSKSSKRSSSSLKKNTKITVESQKSDELEVPATELGLGEGIKNTELINFRKPELERRQSVESKRSLKFKQTDTGELKVDCKDIPDRFEAKKTEQQDMGVLCCSKPKGDKDDNKNVKSQGIRDTTSKKSAEKQRPREPINFSSARLHFLWKLNKGTDQSKENLADISSWRRRIYYVQYAVPTPSDPSPIAYLLYGSEKDEKVVELMTLAPNHFKWSHWEDPVEVSPDSNIQWEKRVLEDEQYELAFLQRKTNLQRQFPTALYPFTVSVFDDEGNVTNSMVLASEHEEDRTMWRQVVETYNPIAEKP